MMDDALTADIKLVLKKYFGVVTVSKLRDVEYADAHMSMYNLLKNIVSDSNGSLVEKYYKTFLDTFAVLAETTEGFKLERMFYGIQFMTKDFDIVNGYTNMMSLVSATYLPSERYSGIRFITMNKVLDSFVPAGSRSYITSYYKLD